MNFPIAFNTWDEWLAFRAQLTKRFTFISSEIQTFAWIEPLPRYAWREIRNGKNSINISVLVPFTITDVQFYFGRVRNGMRYLYVTFITAE